MTTNPKPLNSVEVWIAEHAAPIFAVLAVAIVLGAGAVFWTFQKQGDTQDQVNVLRPQVTKINKAICDERSLETEARAKRCAERIRVGLVNCRRHSRCRAAFLAVLTYPPPARGAASPGSHATPAGATSAPSTGDTGGGGAQQPKGNQPSGPGSQPGHGHGNGHGGGHESAPPAAEPPPNAESGGQGGGQGNGQERPPVGQGEGQGGAQGGSSSGAGVEVCVKGVTCVEAEVGLPNLSPKGTP